MTDAKFEYLGEQHIYLADRLRNITADINNITDVEDYITKSRIYRRFIFFINIKNINNKTKNDILALKTIKEFPKYAIMLISNGLCDIADINDETYICDLHDSYEPFGNYQDI